MGLEDLREHQFDKKPENINKQGRPPKRLVSIVNKELKNEGFQEVNKDEVVEAFLTLLNLPLSKITEIANKENDSYPFLYKFIAKELLGNKGQDMLKEVLDRGLGKAQEKIDHTTKGDKLNITVNKEDTDV